MRSVPRTFLDEPDELKASPGARLVYANFTAGDTSKPDVSELVAKLVEVVILLLVKFPANTVYNVHKSQD